MPTIFFVHSGPRQPIPLNNLAGLLGDLVVSFIVGPLAYAYWTQWIGTIHFGTGATRESLRSFSGGANLEDHPKRGSKWFITMVSDLLFRWVFLMVSACHGKSLGIQSPNLRMAMEPKYLSEVVIIHPVLIIWRSVIGSLGNHHSNHHWESTLCHFFQVSLSSKSKGVLFVH